MIFCVLFVMVLALILTGCKDKNKDNIYFNDFQSRFQFNFAEAGVSFSENVSVYSYDVENDVFVTFMRVINVYDESEYLFLFGLSSADEEYVVPQYTSVISINGDYAVVAKPAAGTDSSGNTVLKPTVGVIKFRGDNVGELTDFNVPYESSYNQFAFVGDYIVCPGLKEMPLSSFNFSTFYDYSRGRMLEVFRVRCGTDYIFYNYDKYLVAQGGDHAFFYETDSVLPDGYLSLDERGAYLAYPEDEEGEYTEAITVNIYYLGNGWFSRTARLESTAAFEGYNILYEKADANTGETQLVYANIRCDFYDAKSRSSTEKDWLIVDAVANEYTEDYYAQMASYLNNLATFDESTGRYEYSLPYLDASKLIKKGYSIVYYYYFPYVESGSYQSEITFCIMDTQAKVISLEDMLMPTAFVDGVGVETSDPMYEEYYGSIYCYDKALNKKNLASNEGGVKTYSTYLYHERGIVSGEISYQNSTVYYGIVDKEGRQIIPFIYDELSPFYGGYAIGSRTVNGTVKTYRIGTDGTETLISDAVNIRQGVYVFQKEGKLGLKNYGGNIIMEAEYDELEVFEVFMKDGIFQTDYVVAKKGNFTTVYRLN